MKILCIEPKDEQLSLIPTGMPRESREPFHLIKPNEILK